MRHFVRLAMVLSAAVAIPASAQVGNGLVNAASDSLRFAGDTTTMRAESPSTSVGAPMTGLRAGVHARETARPNAPTSVVASQHLGQDRAMMVVGAAALITGAIIGGDSGTIIMVGGAVIGLIGLYNYLQ